ncbi:hypothetical protein HDU67_004597, partial [Dinochytrium kinnereticum]
MDPNASVVDGGSLRDSSFREMVKKKREEVKAVSQTVQRRRDSEGLARSRSSTLKGSQPVLKAAVTMGSTTAITSKMTKKGHQVPRKISGSGSSLLQQSASSSLPELLSDAPKPGIKKSLPTLRGTRSQSLSLGPDSSSANSIYRPNPVSTSTQRPGSALSKSVVSSSQPSFIGDSRRPSTGRAGSASSSRPRTARKPGDPATEEGDPNPGFPKVMAVQLHGQPRPKSASFRGFSASTPHLSMHEGGRGDGSECGDDGGERRGPGQEDVSCLKKENQPNVQKRVYRQPPEQPPWKIGAAGSDGKRTPTTLSRATSGNALDRGIRPETPKNGDRYHS